MFFRLLRLCKIVHALDIPQIGAFSVHQKLCGKGRIHQNIL